MKIKFIKQSIMSQKCTSCDHKTLIPHIHDFLDDNYEECYENPIFEHKVIGDVFCIDPCLSSKIKSWFVCEKCIAYHGNCPSCDTFLHERGTNNTWCEDDDEGGMGLHKLWECETCKYKCRTDTK